MIFIISPFFINIPLILVASVPQRFRWKIKNAMCCSPLSLKSSVKLLNSERHDYAKAGVSALMWLSKQLGCLWITRLQCCPLSMLTDWFNCVTVFGGLSALLFNTLLSMYEQLAGLLGLTWWQITRVYRGPEAWLERASLQMQGCVHLCACLCRHFETPKSAIASFRRDLLCKTGMRYKTDPIQSFELILSCGNHCRNLKKGHLRKFMKTDFYQSDLISSAWLLLLF